MTRFFLSSLTVSSRYRRLYQRHRSDSVIQPMSPQYPLCPEADSLESRAKTSLVRSGARRGVLRRRLWSGSGAYVLCHWLTGLEGTTAPLEEIRLAVVFFLSRDEYRAGHEHSGGNSDQGPHSDNPLVS